MFSHLVLYKDKKATRQFRVFFSTKVAKRRDVFSVHILYYTRVRKRRHIFASYTVLYSLQVQREESDTRFSRTSYSIQREKSEATSFYVLFSTNVRKRGDLLTQRGIFMSFSLQRQESESMISCLTYSLQR